MKAAYRDSLRKCLPQAKVVIDHFHLIADANKRIDEERRIIQGVFKTEIPKKLFLKSKENLKEEEKTKMEKFFEKFPDLKTYFFIKEELRTLYRIKNKIEAKTKLETIIRTASHQYDRGLSLWARTLFYWKEEILNYFDSPITNAYTEGLHTKFKLIKRTGFGFKNKEIYIRKIALSCIPLALILPHF